MANLTGQILGERYRVDHFIGRGGMADVYRVWDLQRAVSLACKVLRPELAQDEVFLERFEREARTLEILQHPNIVRFYGLEEADGVAFILMNFIDGLTLRKEVLLTRSGMRPERILEVLRPVCAALFYAHRMGMVHCDIKPANIMLHRNGTVYLTDFGISRMTEASVLAITGAGTPAYMAPEQISGHDPAPGVDIYALGVVLYEMLTGGQRPFTGKMAESGGSTSQKIIWEKHHLPPPSPRIVNPSVSPEMEAVVLRCLNRDARQRFGDTLALLEALEAAVLGDEEGGEMQTLTGLAFEKEMGPQQAALQAGPRRWLSSAYWQQRTRRLNFAGWRTFAHWQNLSTRFWQMPRRRLLAVLGGGLVLALLGLMLATNNASTPGQGTGTAEGSVVLSQGVGSATATAKPTTTTAIRTQPSATRMPGSAAGLDRTPTPQPSPEPTPLGGGRWVALASDRGGTPQVWLIDPQDPLLNRQVTNLPGGACQPAWSPDARQLAFISPCKGPGIYHIGSRIMIADLESGAITDLKLPRNSFDPHWSRDGVTIVYTALVASKAEVHAVNVKTGQIRKMTDRGSKAIQPAYSWNGDRVAFITSDERKNDMLWMMDASGGSLEVVCETALFADPAFSPDNSAILVTVNRSSSYPYLALIDPSDHTKGEVPLLSTTYSQQHGSFSADGKWILFWSELEPGGKGEIMMVSRDGKTVERLTNNTKHDFHPAWSP